MWTVQLLLIIIIIIIIIIMIIVRSYYAQSSICPMRRYNLIFICFNEKEDEEENEERNHMVIVYQAKSTTRLINKKYELRREIKINANGSARGRRQRVYAGRNGPKWRNRLTPCDVTMIKWFTFPPVPGTFINFIASIRNSSLHLK